MSSAAQPNARPANFPQLADVHERQSGANFSLAQVGEASELYRYGVRHPAVGATIRGKVFLKEVLDLTAMEISFGLIPPHSSIPFYHKHKQNEEVYLFLRGEGQFQVDGETMSVREGSVVRVAPDGVRCARNTSDDELFYVVIQAKCGSLEQWTGSDGIGVKDEVVWPN